MEEKYKVLTDNLRWYDIYEDDILEYKERAKGDDYFISPTGQRITPKIIERWLRLGWIVEFTEPFLEYSKEDMIEFAVFHSLARQKTGQGAVRNFDDWSESKQHKTIQTKPNP